jgi:hypothetical protein
VAWNLDDYEDAATLNRWFIDNFPAGRIETRVEYFDAKDQEVVIKAEIYRDAVDTLSASTNFARGKATDYPGKMQRWFFEDTTTSAIARALIILKGSAKTATKESMIQVKGDSGHKVKHPWTPPRSTAVTDPGLPSTFAAIEDDEVVVAKNEPEAPLWEKTVTYLTESLGATPISDELKCSHGLMLVREGTSKAGKPYKGSMCAGKNKTDKCQTTTDGRPMRDGALWWVQNNKGLWEIPRRQ